MDDFRYAKIMRCMKNVNVYKLILLFFWLCIINIACGKEQKNDDRDTTSSTTYKNPVFEPILADPTVIRDPKSGFFYAYGTQDDWGDGAGRSEERRVGREGRCR